MFNEMMPKPEGSGEEVDGLVLYKYGHPSMTYCFSTPVSGGRYICDTNETEEFKLEIVTGITNPTHSYVFIVTQDTAELWINGTRQGNPADFTSGTVSFGSMSFIKDANGTGFYYNDTYSEVRVWNALIFY